MGHFTSAWERPMSSRLIAAALIVAARRVPQVRVAGGGKNAAGAGQMGRHPADGPGGVDRAGRHDRAAAGPRRPSDCPGRGAGAVGAAGRGRQAGCRGPTGERRRRAGETGRHDRPRPVGKSGRCEKGPRSRKGSIRFRGQASRSGITPAHRPQEATGRPGRRRAAGRPSRTRKGERRLGCRASACPGRCREAGHRR